MHYLNNYVSKQYKEIIWVYGRINNDCPPPPAKDAHVIISAISEYVTSQGKTWLWLRILKQDNYLSLSWGAQYNQKKSLYKGSEEGYDLEKMEKESQKGKKFEDATLLGL